MNFKMEDWKVGSEATIRSKSFMDTKAVKGKIIKLVNGIVTIRIGRKHFNFDTYTGLEYTDKISPLVALPNKESIDIFNAEQKYWEDELLKFMNY